MHERVAEWILGYYDGRLSGVYPPSAIHYSNCFDERARVHKAYVTKPHLPFPERAIVAGTVSSLFVSWYRVHSKRYFYPNSDDFQKNWEISTRKSDAHERFSPPGTFGYYFGLSLEAAFSEAKHYCKGQINEDEKCILALDVYLENLLHLGCFGVVESIWDILGFPKPKEPLDYYIELMAPNTVNPICDEIGKWARSQGLSGIIYPTARYENFYDTLIERNKGKKVYPIVINTPIGCIVDSDMIGSGINHMITYMAIRKDKKHDSSLTIYADMNVVLFSANQINGHDRAVFFKAGPLSAYEDFRSHDQRFQ